MENQDTQPEAVIVGGREEAHRKKLGFEAKETIDAVAERRSGKVSNKEMRMEEGVVIDPTRATSLPQTESPDFNPREPPRGHCWQSLQGRMQGEICSHHHSSHFLCTLGSCV